MIDKQYEIRMEKQDKAWYSTRATGAHMKPANLRIIE